MVKEARGDAVPPDLVENLVGDGGGAERICDSLVALEAWCLGGMEEE